ncbi:DMT family transporter [Gryllotalpicola koreensis]|uniref:EamA family transporter n=1 Tax=Gryllotalpicola koreensis TaxID=993086 RepID=A0ABP7ZY16_9MICO
MEDIKRWLPVAAIAPIAWGSTYFVTREFLPPDPLWGAAIRALPAGLVLLAFVRRMPHGSWWWKSAVLGILNVGAFFVLVYAAAQLLPTSLASTIMASSPVALALIAWLIVGERPSGVRLAGAVVGVAGVCVMLWGGRMPVSGTGVAASVAAMLMSSFGFILGKRWNDEVGLLASTSWQLTAGGLMLLPAAAIVEGPPPAVDARALAGYAYVTVIATAVAYVAWFAALRHLRGDAVGLAGLLNPVTGVLLGVFLAGDALGVRQLLGLALVLGGIIAPLIPRRARRNPQETRADIVWERSSST